MNTQQWTLLEVDLPVPPKYEKRVLTPLALGEGLGQVAAGRDMCYAETVIVCLLSKRNGRNTRVKTRAQDVFCGL